MIIRVQAPLVSSGSPARKNPEPRPSVASEVSQASPADLGASIRADGGLRFLQTHLQEKLAQHFGTQDDQAESINGSAPKVYAEGGAAADPEATASRIVGFALGLEQTFARQNPGLDEGELRLRFEEEIRKGVEEGFATARSFLSELGQDDEETTSVIAQTWDLIQQKLDATFAASDQD